MKDKVGVIWGSWVDSGSSSETHTSNAHSRLWNEEIPISLTAMVWVCIERPSKRNESLPVSRDLV